ncbi:hypothetical protein TKK_0000935 [Trichogramma kaykai]
MSKRNGRDFASKVTKEKSGKLYRRRAEAIAGNCVDDTSNEPPNLKTSFDKFRRVLDPNYQIEESKRAVVLVCKMDVPNTAIHEDQTDALSPIREEEPPLENNSELKDTSNSKSPIDSSKVSDKQDHVKDTSLSDDDPRMEIEDISPNTSSKQFSCDDSVHNDSLAMEIDEEENEENPQLLENGKEMEGEDLDNDEPEENIQITKELTSTNSKVDKENISEPSANQDNDLSSNTENDDEDLVLIDPNENAQKNVQKPNEAAELVKLLNQSKEDAKKIQTKDNLKVIDPIEEQSNLSDSSPVEPMEVDGTRKIQIAEKNDPKDTDNSKEKEQQSSLSEKNSTKSSTSVSTIEAPSTSSPKETNILQASSLPQSNDQVSDVILDQDDTVSIGTESAKDKQSKDRTIETNSSEKDAEAESLESHKENESMSNITSTKSLEKPEKSLKVKTLSLEKENNATSSSTNKSTATASDIINAADDKTPEIEEISSQEVCKQCKLEKTCNIKVKIGTKVFNVCSENCKVSFNAENKKSFDIPSEGVNSKREKRCAYCLLIVESKDEKNLSWETMEFCNEECLGKFQTKYGSYCRNCNGSVQATSLGKYCVRFGYDVRQFCCAACLEEFKKGLKVCTYCQKDMSIGVEGFLAPVGDKGQFKDFCTQDCMEKYTRMNSLNPPAPEKKLCGVCQVEKMKHCEVQIDQNPTVAICGEPCLAAFKFVNKVDPDQCSTCKKYFQLSTKKPCVVFHENEAHTFCCKTCLNVFITINRKIVPCNWCKVKKYNFDMIKKEMKSGQVIMMCSLNCLTLYQVSISAVSVRRMNCDLCKDIAVPQYHLTMSDATMRNFCSYKCVMNFQAQYTNSPITIPPVNDSSKTSIANNDPVPTGNPKRATAATQSTRTVVSVDNSPAIQGISIAPKKSIPVISSVTSLAIANGQTQTVTQQSIGTPMQPITINSAHPVIYKQQIITRPTSPVDIANKITQCKPQTHTKGVSVRPIPCDQSTQTDGFDRFPVPIPVPIYVPFPCHMYSMPFPVPVPIPIPIPVPIFIPTTRNTTKGIIKEMKRIQEKTPSDPFEAELLMMAEMVATEKKNDSDSDSVDEASSRDEPIEMNENIPDDPNYSAEVTDTSNTFGDDMIQMALKLATGEIEEEPAVDLETALTPNTIQTPQRPQNDDPSENDAKLEQVPSTRGRKRTSSHRGRGIGGKRGRRSSVGPLTMSNNDANLTETQITQSIGFDATAEKPDANMALKYTFGVNAWRQWVNSWNLEIEKQSTPRKLKPLKTDLLQLTTDELNYSLCLFVKEVRKPNGAEYAPDTIYYLCLGIQQYLFENKRIDNIFTDSYYDQFTDCLNEIVKKFTVLYNDALYVVTRVEEEHLWECKQLGAHSPHVLLNTLMYFNTKHFNLVTVEEHMQLSFSHIMKHWKRNTSSSGAMSKGPGSRNILLRFYPPQSALDANVKKKKVYEQQENEDNPLRCPVKLYEFYLSKCPESVKTRNDVFYLLPERSCVPDSPVWYSTSPLAKDHLIKMLHRIKMVKEINVSLLSC